MKFKHLFPIIGLFATTACTSIDCSLDSVVVWTLTFYDSATGDPIKLPCILSIDAERAGNIYNQAYNVNSIALPMSHTADADTLYLKWAYKDNTNQSGNTIYEVTDKLVVGHENYGHFDAMDCPAAVFHTITSTRFEGHQFAEFPFTIDSVSIIRPQVDYQDVENIRLYFNTSAVTYGSNSIGK